ncbi:LAMI_0H01442g1_1 [Lachancea mirantina]|uniref:Lysophospholipase NTE1 n=1 Tax=Lachancea mirantina TaxID=1230905 RepID=A0A1G4KDU4_9SACH|nr:LAMI_0H01442g1_1 [Lachancea mirantina]
MYNCSDCFWESKQFVMTMGETLLANESTLTTGDLFYSGSELLGNVANAMVVSTQYLLDFTHTTTKVTMRYFWRLVKAVLLGIPSKVYMSSSVDITVPFSTLMICLVLIMLVTYYFVRTRFLNAYRRLQPDEDDEFLLKNKKIQDDTDALFMNNLNDRRRGDFSSYLEEFLSAIKIFGYLEKPVFHELTKSMKTRRLEEGEVMLVDNALGFAIVVEGSLNIYHRVDRQSKNSGPFPSNFDTTRDFENQSDDSLDSDDPISSLGSSSLDGEKFQLLNTVRAGNPISSLISILKLFTETSSDYEDQMESVSNTMSPQPNFMTPFLDSTVEQHSEHLQHSEDSKGNKGRNTDLSDDLNAQADTDHGSEKSDSGRGEELPPVVPELIARASNDCTIAIIPPSSFVRLTSKYPRSASHIIQMILTKLYRVTFQTAHNYLGLTKEIVKTEQVLNASVDFDLPCYLREAVVRRTNAEDKGEARNAADSKPAKHRRPELLKKGGRATRPHSFMRTGESRHVVLDSRDHFNPGDLLSNVPLSRKDFHNAKGNNGGQLYQNSSNGTVSARTMDRVSSDSTHRPGSPSPGIEQNNSSSAVSSAMNSALVDDDVRRRTFSAIQDETEESSWRMALIEGIFAYLGITKQNILPSSNTSNLSNSMRRSSEISLSSSRTSSQFPSSLEYHIIPSKRFPIKHGRSSKRSKKHGEEVPQNIDFDTVKNEFAQGLQTMFFRAGSTVVEQNKTNTGLFYVISGTLEVACKNDDDDRKEQVLYNVNPGGIGGYLAALIGCKSFVSLRAKTDLYVGLLPTDTLERLCDKYFMIYLRIAETLSKVLSPKILKLDYALEWIHLEASETLFNQGDPANAIYVVLSGRLRQLRKAPKAEVETKRKRKRDELLSSRNVQTVGECAQGQSVGEVEVLTAINRLASVVALRETELARIPRTLFELLALEHPSIMIRVSRLVARKILQQQNATETTLQNSSNDTRYDFNLLIPPSETLKGSTIDNKRTGQASGRTYRTISILPIAQGVAVGDFASRLVTALKQVGRKTIGLNQSTTLSHLGRHAFDGLSKLKQSGYFAELEELYDTVVYIADTPVNSSWTQTCIAQGDCILLLAYATMDTDIGEYERLLIKSKTNARVELIFLHEERYVSPGFTHKWLKNRIWIHSEHHVQMSSPSIILQDDEKTSAPLQGNIMDIFRQKERINKITRKTQENISRLLPDSLKATVENLSLKYIYKKQRYYTPVHSHKNDFLRLARILSGQAIGLVLGGGGARGISHLGVLKAIEEQGIPIDMIGGTSIGAFIGGLYAKDYDLVPIYGRVKKFAGRLSSIWRMLTDLTWPVTSYTTGHEFNRGIWKAFGDIRIEDFWIQYYCNSTNITESIQEIHSSGYAWRYIRASMSLAGLLPPIEDNGSMLLDGGYVDNLPVWEMKARGCKTILAVDVGSVDDRTPLRYGDSLNGFWIVFNRWNPFSTHPNVPNMAEIQMRLGYVASVNALEKAKNTPGVIYIRPPIEGYATLDFAKFEEIYEVGAAYGLEFFQKLEADGKMPPIPGSASDFSDSNLPYSMMQRRNSI